MLARLANVVYWAAWGLAALFFIAGAFGAIAGSGSERWFVIGLVTIAGALTWLAGRARDTPRLDVMQNAASDRRTILATLLIGYLR